MHSTFKQQPLDEVLQVIALARPLVEAVARKDRELGSQIRRAFSRVALNVAEAAGVVGGNARLRWQAALGSLYEARAGLRLGIVWGFLCESASAAALEASDRLGARLYRLSRH